jgi:hypothetical protein
MTSARVKLVWNKIAAIFAAGETKMHKNGLKLNGSSPHEMRIFEGQVGQESNLQPAVLESGVCASVGLFSGSVKDES